MARHKQQPIGHLSTRDHRHGLNGYKVYACRCAVCRAAMSAYAKARYVPVVKEAIAPTTSSWWLDMPSQGFMSLVEREHGARMRSSRFGQGIGKPISIDEVSR